MALGAGAMMLPGMQGVGAGWIGAGIGALQGLRTGSLSKGLMAGLGAYGGAGMAGGLMGSGAMQGVVNEAGQDQMALLQQQQAIAADKATTLPLRQAAEQQAAELSKQIAAAQEKVFANNASKGFMEGLSSNFSTASKGLTNGFGNFSNSVGMVPGSIGFKTAAAASLAPALSGAYDNNDVPVQKTSDSDLGAYAKSGAQFHPNWVGPYESRVPGGEYTYARPYYGAEGGAVGMADGGVTGMAEGGTPQRDAYQEYMDYLNNSFPPTTKETVTTPPFQYTTPATPAPAMPFLEAPVSSNTRGGGGMSQEQRDEKNDPNSWSNQTDSQKARHYAYSPVQSQITQLGLEGLKSPISSMGLLGRLFGGDTFVQNIDKNIDIAKGYDPANVAPVMEGYTRISPPDQHRLTVKEADTLSNETSNAKIARIIAEAQAAAYPNTPPPGTVPTPTITAAPAGTVGSAPPQGDGAQRAQAVQAAQDARVAAFDAGRTHEGGGGGQGSVNPGGYSNSMTRSNDNVGGSQAADGGLSTLHGFEHMARGGNVRGNLRPPAAFFQKGKFTTQPAKMYAGGGASDPYNLGSYSDGGRLLKGPGDGVSDSIPATIGKGQPARLADGEFVIPARIVSEIGNGSTEAGARKLYAMMDRIQKGRRKTVGRGKVAVNSRADRYLPA
jgi:hypothetical protein